MGWRKGACIVLILAPLAVSPARGAEAPPFDWSGFYAGYHLGGALDLVDVDDPFGPSIFGDIVRTPGPLAGGQIGYNWQRGAGLLGFEADISFADLDGTNTCFAFSGNYISANCRAEIDALGTIAGRLGWILPSDGRTLLFGKAGLAWAHGDIDAKPNGGLGLPGTSDDGVTWGWTVGAGVERAITPRWTAKAEYGFLSFDEDFAAPSSRFQSAPPLGPLAAFPGSRTDLSQNLHQFKLGMNYKLGATQGAEQRPRSAGDPARRYALTAGLRYVHGWGQFHKDLGIPFRGVSSLASRLTYDNTSIDGGEAFARLDTPFGLMVKGLVGGATSGGKLNDEDWALPFPTAFVPYSNTLSRVDNDIDYGIIDAGYDVWRGAGYSVAPFIGYSRFEQDMTGIGCVQLANRFSDCVPSLPNNLRAITEDDTWEALRLGAVADVTITPRVNLTAEAAYLPYVKFRGVDDHLLRNLVSPEHGEGTGVQLEAALSYAVTDALSLGVGGRYWSMWTTSGNVNFGGTGTIVPMRYAAEQAHLLVQGSYKFGFAPAP
ncbi:MAG: outer membrane beta-barrel protein [Methyloceanibacter sp.]|uniref:outer membrane beta-barrel protein n=1 Tax=Methyloceanibacter sp. TaxID=1965321 RepID=UPI003D6CEEE7